MGFLWAWIYRHLPWRRYCRPLRINPALSAQAEKVAAQVHDALHEESEPGKFLDVLEAAVIRAVGPHTPEERSVCSQAVRATACILSLERYLSDRPLPDWPPYRPPV